MYSFIDLLLILFYSIIFVLMFKAIRKFFPKKYFELSRLIFGNGVTIRMRIIRSVVIFAYSYMIYVILGNQEAAIFSIMLGSFLIVWPVILNPEQFNLNETGWYKQRVHVNKKGKIYLYSSYAFFIFYSTSIAVLAVKVGNVFFDLTKKSFESWIDGLIMYFILAIFFENGSKIFEGLLSKNVNKSQEKVKRHE